MTTTVADHLGETPEATGPHHYRNSERIVRTLNQLLSQLQFTSIAAHLHLQHSAEAVAAPGDEGAPARQIDFDAHRVFRSP